MTRSLSIFALLCFASTAGAAGRVGPKTVEASSAYPTENGVSYDASKSTDGKLATAWVEGEEGSGLGSWLKIHVDGDQELTGVRIWGGLWSSYDFWTRANRPKSLEFKFEDGSTEVHELEDNMEAQTLTFSKPRASGSVRIRIKSVYNGNTWFDTAISEVQLIGSRKPDFREPTGFQVSSKLADDGDGNYNPSNLTDGVLDSMWCEGSEEGDGTGEWIEYSFGSAVPVSSMTALVGVGGNLGAWMKSNRATAARLTFSDGSTHNVDLKNSAALQSVSFPAKTTRSVKLTFTEVYQGKDYNDLCISELYFR